MDREQQGDISGENIRNLLLFHAQTVKWESLSELQYWKWYKLAAQMNEIEIEAAVERIMDGPFGQKMNATIADGLKEEGGL